MVLAWNRYGKSHIRLVKVRRPQPDDGRTPHDVIDLTIDVQLEGRFDAVYVDGDNAGCLATDTMKNTVYAFARTDPLDHPEAFALRLSDHFAAKPDVERVRISMTQHPWQRLTSVGFPHPHAFVQSGTETWTAVIERVGHGAKVTAGVADLVVPKTTDSAFSGFPRDEYTTLPETEDRILATSMTASWTYETLDGVGYDFSAARARIRHALLDTFAAHDSRSVQHTLYAMGRNALAACAEASDITLTMPNRHHLPVDLTPFGLDNPNVVFVATDQPFGLIEATVRR